MAIPQSCLQELLARADVVEIVGRYVQLKKGGVNFSGLCPFHAEKSPSFTVSPSKQFYHCFGCGKNGNAISFLMEHAGMTFIEAVKDLAQQYGMQVPEDDTNPQDRARAAEQRQKQATLSDVLEKAGEAYRKHLKNTPRPRDPPQAPGPPAHTTAAFDLEGARITHGELLASSRPVATRRLVTPASVARDATLIVETCLGGGSLVIASSASPDQISRLSTQEGAEIH